MPKTILRNLQIGFGISLLILLASSTASYISIHKQNHNSAMVDHSRRVMSRVNKILQDLQNAETGQRGFLLTGMEKFLEPYKTGLQSLPQSLSRAHDLTSDNPEQQQIIDTLSTLVQSRLAKLESLVNIKKRGGMVSVSQLEEGKTYMDSCRLLISKIIDREELLLNKRSEELGRSSGYTSIFVLLAAVVSLLITLFFYFRLRADFFQREQLQNDLKRKDEEIQRRLSITQRIAREIAAGHYDMQIQDGEQDDLGSLTGSLNEMARSLKTSFEELNNNNWHQAGLTQLGNLLMGNKQQEELTAVTLGHLTKYGNCVNGAIYLMEQDELVLRGSYGLEDPERKRFAPGEGMVGQVFKDKKEKLFENLEDTHYVISFAAGKVLVNNLFILPVFDGNNCIGVMELGALQPFSSIQLAFFRDAVQKVGTTIAAAQARLVVQNLLEETQAQTEELQAQHTELESLNSSLEMHTYKLQASEEELRVQQEELVQSNRELEERSKLLEDKNVEIAERNQEIQKKAAELEQSTRYKSEFLANMSHELRTPLNSILLLSRLMAENSDGNLNDEQMESAAVIQSSGKSLLTLIDEILDLSKIESGKMDLDVQPVFFADILNGLTAMFAPIAADKQLGLEMTAAAGLPLQLETDKQRLDQILRNLLSNAIKFTAAGKVTLSIDRQQSQSDRIVFEVRDTGIGIPKDKQHLIFEAFQQADGSTRRKFGGTGLGLSISRELARLLGGEILLESEENRGSVFRLILPERISDATPAAFGAEQLLPVAGDVEPIALDSAAGASTAVVQASQTVNLSAEKTLEIPIPADIPDDRDSIVAGDRFILIVEDDIEFAKILLKYTRQQNYKGIVVVRGDIAAEMVARYMPLAVLLDIQLPLKDGWQVMAEIKENPKTRHIPVHIMSSLQVKRESLLQGAIDFINKPMALEQMGDMFRKIEDALTRHPKKVLIVEENPKHAAALSLFLGSFDIASEIKNNVEDSIVALSSDTADCVILDMGVPDRVGYETLEAVKRNQGLENLPIIVFTGKNLSQVEEMKLKRYADSIIVKTANSYQRILDEVGLFLHLVEENSGPSIKAPGRLGFLQDVLQGKKVLVADDDIRNIFSLTKALEKYQMTVVPATDGKDALKQLEDNPDVAVILMDMMMPEMDGYETIASIRKDPRYKDMPIIAVTAKSMMGDREKCIAAGASDYISKPVDIDQLLSLLRVWMYE
ncbi:histidine kinase [Sphingobacterium sp. Ag1]|uniref:response regulator n=1 Tax=Sphingobacterium sp. Ag1 TaxID=1643451 RepID=UPI0006274D8C|nr:response regulator [Sphingobacterium sp. Ag1]KKO89725.1 histidine kinase [Sphingobacterium sp. Ag1]